MTTTVATTVASRLGDFAADLAYDDLPAEVLDKARACLAHGLLIAAAGRLSPLGTYAEAAVGSSAGPARLLTSGRRVATAHAALVNATVFHSRVQEDTYGTSHLGTVVLPTALAVGEEIEADGRALLVAIVAGYEVAAALAGPGTARSSARGFRASSVYGPFAAATVASKLRGGSAAQIAASVSYASAFGGGTLQSFAEGTPEWQFQNGVAAHNGVIAAGLVAAGACSAPTGIEGPAGFLAAFCGATDGAETIGSKLGSAWAMREVTFKLFPVCAFNQGPVTLAARLVSSHQLRPEDVRSARITMNAYEAGYPGMAGSGPFSTIGATQMSTRFCVATGLVRGGASYADLLSFDDPGVNGLVDRIELVPDPARAPMTCALTVETIDGRLLEECLEEPPERYLSWGFDRSRVTAESLGDELDLGAGDVELLLHRIGHLEEFTAADVMDPMVRELRSAKS